VAVKRASQKAKSGTSRVGRDGRECGGNGDATFCATGTVDYVLRVVEVPLITANDALY
jgi:hypothetical protein